MGRRKRCKISDAKKKHKNVKKSLKRKTVSERRKFDVNQARALRRRKQKESAIDSLIHCERSDSDDNNENFGCRTSDRKFLESNAKVLANGLERNNCGQDSVKLFGKKLENVKWHVCGTCHVRYLGVSKKCWCTRRYVVNSRLMLIGTTPIVLKCLTLIEELLIARVHPVVQVYRLIGGQTGYSGHVINFFQDVKEVAVKLPHAISDLNDIVKVSYDKLEFHRDFKIRKQCVLNALMHLIESNKFYGDVIIDMEAVALLPDDGSFHGCGNVDEKGVSEDGNIISTAVPSCGISEADKQMTGNMSWPKINSDPISELSSAYICQAFPSLFPTGEGDLFEVKDKNLTPRVYFQYLMDYEDGRFASHKIFPYFALNSVMRWECLSKGTVYIKDHPLMKKMNIQVLKDLIEKNPDIMKDLLVYGSSIRGTKEFWSSKSAELDALCDYRGLPTVFFTSSAADMRWPGLKELILEQVGSFDENETKYYQHVINNPKICADYFYEIFTLFFEEIVLGHFNVVDFWYRYEWQMRGSPHVHGVLWLKDAVNVKCLEEKFDEMKDSVVKYFDKLISCYTPNTNFVEVGAHPCSLKISEVLSEEDDIASLVNSVQMHVCSKKCTNDGKRACKYGFPKDLREESALVMNKRKYYEFHGKRNHPSINQFNKDWLRSLRSNCDFTAILSDHGFRQYISKYVSKSEVKSRSLVEILSTVLEGIKESTSVKSSVQRTFIAALVERDYSAQEVHHLLSGKKLYSCSRSFVKVNMKNSEWKYHIPLDGGEVLKDQYNHVFYSYAMRPEKLKNVSLISFIEKFNLDTYSPRRRKAVAVIYPRLKYSGEGCEMDEVARQLVLLHVPWTDIDAVVNNACGWISQMEKNNLTVEQLPYFKSHKPEAESIDNDSDDDSSAALCGKKDEYQDDWMAFVGASIGANVESAGSSTFNHNPLVPFVRKDAAPEEVLVWKNFIEVAKKNGIEHVLRHRDANVFLSEEQNQIINLVSIQISCLKDGTGLENFPQLVLCQGAAGCGKTVIIAELECMITEAFGPNSVIICAYTGSSAVNANGRTIHNAFRLQFEQKSTRVNDLRGETLKRFQEENENVKFIVLEEYSLIGPKLLNIINRRCMQMKGNTEPFGGLRIYMFGDLFQLPPIGDSPLYNFHIDPDKTDAYAGSLLFQNLVRTKFLDVHHRQVDPQFVEFLDCLSRGNVTTLGRTFIEDRFECNMTAEEIHSFEDAVHIFQFVKQVSAWNKRKLYEIGNGVISIDADNNNDYAKYSSDELAGNLQDVLEVCIGAKVMLRANIWTEGGLVNGSVGVIEDIIFSDVIHKEKPAFIMVKFEDYHGPTLDNGCVPISRILRSWYVSHVYCSRIQFPLTLSYAMTVHRSQGLTLRKIVAHFDSHEMCSGAFYVALSRVREKSHLMICGFSGSSPLFSINERTYRLKIEGKEWLLSRSL